MKLYQIASKAIKRHNEVYADANRDGHALWFDESGDEVPCRCGVYFLPAQGRIIAHNVKNIDDVSENFYMQKLQRQMQ